MNIEIANRLVELRKKNGLSQEELAEKLGLSRQAVSKWERAESSPDTDNLICLAKLYNVSLDDLLNTDQSIEDISRDVKEKQLSDEELGKEIERRIENKVKGKYDHLSEKDRKRAKAFDIVDSTITGVLFIAAAIVYFVLSYKDNTQWSKLWIIFMAPIVISSILTCIKKRRFAPFAFPVFAAMVFFYIGMYYSTWHPTWVIFLTVPIYYMAVKPFDMLIAKKRDEAVDPDDEKDDDDDDDDDDEDEELKVEITE